MKRLIATIMLGAVMAPTAALAAPVTSQPGYSNQCFTEVYNERYVPGTMSRPGHIERWTDSVEVPCGTYGPVVSQPHAPVHPTPHRNNIDDNSCVEGAILGGLLGGGAGAAASRGDGRWWAIPLGVVGGSMVGCQLDGG